MQTILILQYYKRLKRQYKYFWMALMGIRLFLWIGIFFTIGKNLQIYKLLHEAKNYYKKRGVKAAIKY